MVLIPAFLMRFQTTGASAKSPSAAKAAMTFLERMSAGELMDPSCCPAKANTAVPGMMPTAVVQRKVLSGTFVRPARKLTRKRGKPRSGAA